MMVPGPSHNQLSTIIIYNPITNSGNSRYTSYLINGFWMASQWLDNNSHCGTVGQAHDFNIWGLLNIGHPQN